MFGFIIVVGGMHKDASQEELDELRKQLNCYFDPGRFLCFGFDFKANESNDSFNIFCDDNKEDSGVDLIANTDGIHFGWFIFYRFFLILSGTCPICSTGTIVERNGPHGPFYGCSNFRAGTCRWSISARQYQLGMDPHLIQKEKLQYSKKPEAVIGTFI